MKKHSFAALLTALMMLGTCAACGDNSVPAQTGESAVQSADSAEESMDESTGSTDSESSAVESSKTEKQSESSTAETKNEKKNESSSEESSKEKAKETSAPKAETSKPEEKEETKENKENNDNNTDNKTEESSKDNDDDDNDAEDVEKPTKYIYLKDTTAQYSGEGITVKGGLITIAKGGTYEISGTLSNGQIFIQTDKKKVKLHLNGASITNKAGAAINCQAAKKLTIKTLPGTVNYLEDGGTHDEDKGTVFSEDTVSIKGEGELNITANYAHGIQSDDDIVVNSGNVNITAAKSCLHSNDGIEINGGTLFCNGGTNGIKTDGYINITGGSTVMIGGVREEKGAIYCDGPLTITGGQFWAIGNTCTAPDAETTTANVIGVMFPSALAENTVVNVTCGNNPIFTMTSPNKFKYVIYSGPELLPNAEYQVRYGGTCTSDISRFVYSNGNEYDPGENGKDGGKFTAGNNVTFYTVTG